MLSTVLLIPYSLLLMAFPASAVENPATTAPYISENTAFATSLHSKLAANSKGNIVSSPLGVHTILLTALQGADGSTATALRKVVGNASASNPQAALEATDQLLRPARRVFQSTSAVWLDNSPPSIPWNRGLLSTLSSSGFDILEFPMAQNPGKAASKINSFFQKHTRNAIKEIVTSSDISSDSTLLLGSAAHFEGNWANAFKKSETRDEIFHLEPAGTVEVPMMRVEDATFRTMETEAFAAFELPYKACGLSMLVILPKSGDLSAMESRFTATELARLRANPVEQKFSLFALPRFEFDSQLDLEKPLASLGLAKIFSEAADFQKFLDPEARSPLNRAKVGKFLQNAMVRVNEKGTKAASATVATTIIKMASVNIGDTFMVDRPFLFVIQDTNTGLILFIGRVKNPLEKTTS